MAPDTARLRAWRAHKQGLDGAMTGQTPADVLALSGWARSVGGVAPYLTLFARARASRPETDAAVDGGAIQELPAARGCTYVVPAAHFALALAVGESFREEDRRRASQLGVSSQEIDRLCAKVLDALAAGPLDPAAIKAAVGGAVRSLGEAGKKKGLSTTLPVALAVLQSAGEIRRISVDGRLDAQRYRYALWRPNPRAGSRLAQAEALHQLARLFWQWIGPARLAEFQSFSGFPLKAVREAAAQLHLTPAGDDPDLLILPGELEALLAWKAGRQACPCFVSSLDSIVLLRRSITEVLPHPAPRIAMVEGLSELPANAILDRGTLTGLWEYDPGAGAIVWHAFGSAGKETALEAGRTEEFIRTQLGDARTFSLDSPRHRRPRIEALRRAGKPA